MNSWHGGRGRAGAGLPLTAARGSHNGENTAGGQGEADVLQNVNVGAGIAEREVGDLDADLGKSLYGHIGSVVVDGGLGGEDGAAIGEWLGSQSGLGYFSRRMMTQLDGAGVFAPIVLLSAVAMLAVALVALLEKKIVRWRGEF